MNSDMAQKPGQDWHKRRDLRPQGTRPHNQLHPWTRVVIAGRATSDQESSDLDLASSSCSGRLSLHISRPFPPRLPPAAGPLPLPLPSSRRPRLGSVLQQARRRRAAAAAACPVCGSAGSVCPSEQRLVGVCAGACVGAALEAAAEGSHEPGPGLGWGGGWVAGRLMMWRWLVVAGEQWHLIGAGWEIEAVMVVLLLVGWVVGGWVG